MRSDLAGLTFAEFAAWTRGLAGHSERFHSALFRALHATGTWRPEAVSLWRREVPAATIQLLASAADERQMPAAAAAVRIDDPASGATTKLRLRLADGAEVETVLVPMGGGSHATVCLSTQVGCRMGCAFCATARMGLVRHLAAHEIVGQALAVAAHTGIRPRNAVFMGMGEPLDNPEAVSQAVRILADRRGWGLANRHITISTVGRIEPLRRWATLGLGQVNLAVSLVSADPGVRAALLPVARGQDLAGLRQAIREHPLEPDRRVMLSCVVIPGVTDTPEQIGRLADFCQGLRVLVNLIPYNPIPGRDWRTPRPDEVEALRTALDAAGVPVRLRRTKGDAAMAACGQLVADGISLPAGR